MARKPRQLQLFYKDIAVTADLYILEFTDEKGENKIQKFTGPLAYEDACVTAYKKGITGIIMYPLTRSRQFVVAGIVKRRGRKPSKQKTDRREGVFVKVVPQAGMEILDQSNFK